MAVAAATLLCLSAAPLRATSFAPLPLAEMVARSTDIVHGRVAAVTSRWNGDHTAIETESVVEVIEGVKGTAAGEIRVVWPGGEVGALRMEAAGLPPFRKDEEVVLLLEAAADGRRSVTGLSQGRFDVHVAPDDGAKTVRLRPESSPDARVGGSVEELGAFLERLRALSRRRGPAAEHAR